MWIEILSQEDNVSLEALKSHLNKLADENLDYADIYYSLIALIHYELDEREAAELMYQSQLSGKSNLYHRELGFWLGASKEQVTPDHSWLSEYSSVDYMVVEKITNAFKRLMTAKCSSGLPLCQSLL